MKKSRYYFFEVMELKKFKIKICSELIYVIALLLLPLSVAMMTAADYGISMIVAPAYILSLRFSVFTFGQWNYILQGFLFIAFCIAVKRFKPIYLVSFLTCVIYGTILDLWMTIIPALNPDITPAGSMDTWVRLALFIGGLLITSFSVTFFFRSYIYPQVCDFFIKGLIERYNLNQTKSKWIYDMSYLIISIVLSLTLLGEFKGVEWGTIVVALIASQIIGVFSKVYDRFFETVPLFKKAEKLFKY